MIEIIREQIARLQERFEALPVNACAASRRQIGKRLFKLVGLLEDVEREGPCLLTCRARPRQG